MNTTLLPVKPRFAVARPFSTSKNKIKHKSVLPPSNSTSPVSKAGASGYAVDGNLRPTSPKAWELISTTLRSAKLKMVSPQEVAFAQKRGIPIIDVRPSNEFSQGRIPGAVSIEFFRLIQGWDPVKIGRRAVYAFFGVLNGTEFNPQFLEEFSKQVPDKKKGAIVYCNIGGTLDPTGPSEFGQQSRSLTAAYELLRAGYSNIQVMSGGYSGWVKSDREIEYEE